MTTMVGSSQPVSCPSIFDIKSTTIEAGDTVIVYQSRDNLTAIVVTPGQQLNTRFGEFPHADMIGTQFGSKCPSRKGNGFTYLLRPTPELWTLALPHRTQILYHPDISFIISRLDIKPGSYVIEAGTGSGSFSHSLARTIGRTGKLFSFEFHEERFEKAASEFEAHGLLSTVGGPIHLAHRNVIRDGFGDLGVMVDSVFLDLPAPWDALENAKRLMDRTRISSICCFSPCIEQVQKTCQTLESLGFSDLTMFETLVRTHEPVSVVTANVEDAVRRIKEVEMKKEVRRARQIAEANSRKQANQIKPNPQDELTGKRSLETIDTNEEPDPKKLRNQFEQGTTNGMDVDESLPAVKKLSDLEGLGSSETANRSASMVEAKPATENATCTDKQSVQNPDSQEHQLGEEEEKKECAARPTAKGKADPRYSSLLETSKPAGMSRGHTSFLTFAVLLPLPSNNL